LDTKNTDIDASSKRYVYKMVKSVKWVISKIFQSIDTTLTISQ